MYRVVSVVVLVVLLLGSISAIAAFTVEDLGPRVEVLETQVAELRSLHGLNPTGTPEPEPTATNTAVPPTNTPVPPTATQVSPTATNEPVPTVTPTNEPEACSVPEGASVWHEPTTHEHGDAPPQWADDWSCEQFGHPVIFGGDESTPNENAMKHEAYKGYAFTARSDEYRHDVDIYVRLHMQSNPHGRAAQYHSYEMYVRDETGAISFWQGWLDFGPAPGHRDTHSDGSYRDLIPSYSPSNHIIGWDDEGNTYYADSFNGDRIGKEFWYAQQSTPDGWDPVILVDVYDPSTYTMPDEHLDPMNQSTWQATGDYGLDRRIVVRFIVDGSTARTVAGRPYLQRNALNPRGWFCATPLGDITASSVSGPAECEDALPQHIATSMPTIGDTKSRAIYSSQWPCPDCTLPN